jgi:hypothetical protein
VGSRLSVIYGVVILFFRTKSTPMPVECRHPSFPGQSQIPVDVGESGRAQQRGKNEKRT